MPNVMPKRPVIPDQDPDEVLKNKSANLHVRQWEMLERVAKETNRSANEVLRLFIDWALEAYEDDRRAADEKKGK